MREAATPSQRSAITLRCLSTGNAFEDLKLVSALSPYSVTNYCTGEVFTVRETDDN